MALHPEIMLKFLEYTKKNMDDVVKIQMAFDIERKTNFIIEPLEFRPNSQYNYLDNVAKTLPIDKKLYYVAKYLTTVSVALGKDLNDEDSADFCAATMAIFAKFASKFGCDIDNSITIMTNAAKDVEAQVLRRSKDIADATEKLEAAKMMFAVQNGKSRLS